MAVAGAHVRPRSLDERLEFAAANIDLALIVYSLLFDGLSCIGCWSRYRLTLALPVARRVLGSSSGSETNARLEDVAAETCFDALPEFNRLPDLNVAASCTSFCSLQRKQPRLGCS
jgi:hypothetical protein